MNRSVAPAFSLLLVASLGAPAPTTRPTGAWAASAAIKLQVAVGPPTTSTLVRGRRFGPSETVDLAFDGVPLRTAVTGPKGTFLTRASIPASAVPGDHVVEATGETSGSTAVATFTVRTDWPTFHFDPARTGYNPYENVLSPANVHGLTEAWNFTTGGPVTSAPAVANGMVYVGSHDDNLYALDAATGAPVWTFPAGGNVSSPTVVDGVVYVAAGEAFTYVYALDAFTFNTIAKMVPIARLLRAALPTAPDDVS